MVFYRAVALLLAAMATTSGIAQSRPVSPQPRIVLAPRYARSVPRQLPHLMATDIVRWNAIRRYALRRYAVRPLWMNTYYPCPPGYRYFGAVSTYTANRSAVLNASRCVPIVGRTPSYRADSALGLPVIFRIGR